MLNRFESYRSHNSTVVQRLERPTVYGEGMGSPEASGPSVLLN
ncbi:hypothetical protein [Aequorivita nionensis]